MRAVRLAPSIIHPLSSLPSEAQAIARKWEIVRDQLKPEDSLETKVKAYNESYRGWQEEWGTPPVWWANEARLATLNTQQIITATGMKGGYDELLKRSSQDSKRFWETMVKRLGVKFKTPYNTIVDATDHRSPEWFKGATLNLADSLLQADPYKNALVYRKEGQTTTRNVTYGELSSLSNQTANALVKAGFKKGDAIAIAMPMNVEAVAAYIGILKMGGTVICLPLGLSGPEIKTRLDQIPSGVKAVIADDTHQKVISTLALPNTKIINISSQEKWDIFVANTDRRFTSSAMKPNDNLAVIFSSGTTGAPKAIPWKAHTFVKSAIDAHLHHNMSPAETLCWPTNFGWMMGSFDLAAALMNRGTLALYEGKPTTRAFGEFVRDAGVTVLGLTPAYPKEWQKSGCMNGLDWSSIKRFSSTGAPSEPSNYFWLMSMAKGFRPVVEYMGGTEIGGGYVTNTEHRPFNPSVFNTPTLGTSLRIAPREIIKDGVVIAKEGEVGLLLRDGAEQTPPMGLSNELVNRLDHHERYYAQVEGMQFRRHGDILKWSGTTYRSDGRSDDVININGAKTSAEELEGFIRNGRIAGVKDVAVINYKAGEVAATGKVVACVVLDDAAKAISMETLRRQMNGAIKKGNPALSISTVCPVPEILTVAGAGVKIQRDRMKIDLKDRVKTLVQQQELVSKI